MLTAPICQRVESRPKSGWHTWLGDILPRGLALFLGGFAIVNLLGETRHAGFDANLWWIDLRWAPPALANGLLLVSGICLIAFALKPSGGRVRRVLTVVCASLLGLAALFNTGQFVALLLQRAISAAFPLPFSLLVALGASVIAASALRPAETARGARHFGRVIAVCVACVAGFPLAQMLCFGKTDYRRPADMAVVLGARAYADGRPSDALADRVRTACQLYQRGITKKLLFSGGPGDGAVHETEAMKQMALRLGVKSEDILIDEGGVNTRACRADPGREPFLPSPPHQARVSS
jgi:uncharacterized SAM-binding protein YcdF (DUF218 family)